MSGKWPKVSEMTDDELMAASAMLHKKIIDRQKNLMTFAGSVGEIIADEKDRLVIFYEEMSERTGTDWVSPSTSEALIEGAQTTMEASEKSWRSKTRLTNLAMRLSRYLRRIRKRLQR